MPLGRSVRDAAKPREANWYESPGINKSETKMGDGTLNGLQLYACFDGWGRAMGRGRAQWSMTSNHRPRPALSQCFHR